MIHVQPEDDLLARLKQKVDATIAEMAAILTQEGPLLERKSELARQLAVWVDAVKIEEAKREVDQKQEG